LSLVTYAATVSAGSWELDLDAGIRERGRGNISESVRLLEGVTTSAPDPAGRLRATRELALSLVQAGRLTDADKILQAARGPANAVHGASAGSAQAAITLALGNVQRSTTDSGRSVFIARFLPRSAAAASHRISVCWRS
jgi:hypothetical protein